MQLWVQQGCASPCVQVSMCNQREHVFSTYWAKNKGPEESALQDHLEDVVVLALAVMMHINIAQVTV